MIFELKSINELKLLSDAIFCYREYLESKEDSNRRRIRRLINLSAKLDRVEALEKKRKNAIKKRICKV